MAAITTSSPILDIAHSKSSPSPTSPTGTRHIDHQLTTSRSFINIASPRTQSSFPATPMSSSCTLDPPPGTTFADFLRTWNDAHVARWLADNRCPTHIDSFKNNDIRGDILLELDQDTLKEIGIASIGDRLRIVNAVKNLRSKCSPRNTIPSVSAIAHTRAFLGSLDSRLLESPRTNGVDHSHARTSSRELSTSREPSPTSRTHKRLDSNRPAPLVLSPSSGRPDLPRIIREPQSSDSMRNPSTIRPLPQIGPSPQSTTPNSYTSSRPSLPPLPPAPRGQPPQPPRVTSRSLHPVNGPRTRTPNQADATNYTNSPLPPAPTSTPSNMLTTPTQPSSWSFGLPPDPRSGPSKPIQSASPLASRSPSLTRSANAAHNRNISFSGVPSPLAPTPTNSKRPSTTGHPYASVQAPASLQAPAQNGSALSPINESFQPQGSASSSGSSSPPAFAVGRGPFNPTAHNAVLDHLRRKLVKFIVPEEQRSYTVDVADCAGGIEVMEKVLKKADKVGSSRRNDVTSRVETDDGGLSVDGWSVYLAWDETNDSGKPLSEAELLAVCHSSTDDPVKERGLTLRKSGRTKRSKDLQRIFGENPPRNISPTSPIIPPRPSESDHELDADTSTISVLSGLGVRDPEKALDPSASPTQGQPKHPLPSVNSAKKPSKLRNFFGQRPPSELITTHLTEYFPFTERKLLRNARHSMMLRASSVSGEKRNSTSSLTPPLPSRFSTSTQGSGSAQRSMSPVRTMSSKRNSTISTSSTIPDTRSLAAPSIGEDPPRVSISTEDGRSVILTGDDVEKLSSVDSKPQLLPPVTFPSISLSESMEDLTGPLRPRSNSNASKRMSFMTELRSKRDRSDTASLLTVDEITAEVENRRQSMAVDMGVEGAEDWTKVEPDIDDVTSLSEDDTVLEEDEDEDESEDVEEEDETGQAMNSSGGKWIKGALIGAGSFGKVYLGMDAVNGLLMAVKQVELPRGSAPNEERKKNMLSALEREIDLLKDLSHPNIVQYLYSSVDDDFLNIFLEYVPGGSVTALLRSYGAFEEPLVKNFVRQILQGLNYLHERDIIHRDIKGANILVDNKGGIKISDFGISKKVDGNLLTGKRMNRPSLQGSAFWMAPEVVKQTAHTSAADIWSVGCLVVEMLTGEHPWAQLTQMQAIFKIGQSAKPAIPSDISSEAQDFLTKTFDINHSARPSAGGLLQHSWLAVKKHAGFSNKNVALKSIPTIEISA
ncbi:Pkinase-domain-containing protein [Suillus paluster]|uniref:Pkinase-domain-containing protein n=1 Tax=Suillus paluster TaxID=48578 RepID=UPI001B871E8B|nr:Pkinase-domain-containing protein [Suillus paluster]KAG1756726.1 Pkinase-domain-containing protein [Suillus paluster]